MKKIVIIYHLLPRKPTRADHRQTNRFKTAHKARSAPKKPPQLRRKEPKFPPK